MIDDPALTWIDVPPPPSTGSDEARAAATAIVDGGLRVTVAGSPGSGRRTAALLATQTLGAPAYLIPALPWRAPGALREIARRLGIAAPDELSPRTLVQLARGAMIDHTGTVVLDARVRVDPSLIDALTVPGWRTIVLVPDDDAARFGATVDLPPPPAPEAPTGDDAIVCAAAAYFDPWEGAPRALLPGIAALDPARLDSAISRSLERGWLRPHRDHRRVLPTLSAHQERPDPADPTNHALAARFVATMATWCARAGEQADHALADDRANLMTSLSIWHDVAPIGLVDGFAQALPMLLDDVGCHPAAKLVIQATRFGSDTAQAMGDHANRRMGWSS